MTKLSGWIYRWSNGWLAILSLVLFVSFSVSTLPAQNRLAEEYSRGMGSPDTSIFYSGAQLYQMASGYGETGRQQYLHARWTFDLAFPLVYTLFLLTSISWLYNRNLGRNSKWRLLNLVPLGAMILDFLENTMTSLVFSRFPMLSLPGQVLAPVFTPLKWLLVSISFCILVVGIIWRIYQLLYQEKLANG
jgi:succinate dehydrogenase hydrophobic anchor subunit